MVVEPELKPCPFCGGVARMEEEKINYAPYSFTSLRVYCSDCGIRTPNYPSDGYYGLRYTPEQVADRWNKRACITNRTGEEKHE